VRVLLHSIAFGNLKPAAPPPTRVARDAIQKLAVALDLEDGRVQDAVDEWFATGAAAAHPLASPPRYSETDFLEEEDFSRTIFNMGTSLLGWVQELFERKLFRKGHTRIPRSVDCGRVRALWDPLQCHSTGDHRDGRPDCNPRKRSNESASADAKSIPSIDDTYRCCQCNLPVLARRCRMDEWSRDPRRWW
jgi:hypothetical protein